MPVTNPDPDSNTTLPDRTRACKVLVVAGDAAGVTACDEACVSFTTSWGSSLPGSTGKTDWRVHPISYSSSSSSLSLYIFVFRARRRPRRHTDRMILPRHSSDAKIHLQAAF